MLAIMAAVSEELGSRARLLYEMFCSRDEVGKNCVRERAEEGEQEARDSQEQEGKGEQDNLSTARVTAARALSSRYRRSQRLNARKACTAAEGQLVPPTTLRVLWRRSLSA